MTRAGLLLLLLSAAATAAPCPTRATWPTASWPSQVAETAAARPAAVKALDDYAFTLEGADAERKGVRTDGVVVVHKGAIIYERYGRGFTAEMRHLAWSVTKSVTNAMLGAAVLRGEVALGDSICKHLPNLAAHSCAITVEHLLEMASALDWREVYENESNQASSVLAMLYGEGHKDMAAFVAAHPLAGEPGKLWAYSTGDANLLSALVDAAMRQGHGEEYAWKYLFDPVGMKSVIIERDHQGASAGGSYFYATPRDYARFGYLYLSDGCWEGQRLLPEDWVREASTVSAAFKGPHHFPGEDSVNGREFWLNVAVPEHEIKKPWPDAPDDAYSANGHWGQYITVIPSLDLVVVRTGDDRDKTFKFNTFLGLAIALVKP
ncbi:MAG: serine hydrolase domain-containing protein [Myxococcaceae bacterium]